MNTAARNCFQLNVLIGDEDERGSFIFRTRGHNFIRALAARLKYSTPSPVEDWQRSPWSLSCGESPLASHTGRRSTTWI